LKVCRSIKKVGPSLKLETLPVLCPRIPLFSLRQHADGDGKSLPQPPVGKVGSELKLLVDEPLIARTEADAPDVDARVILLEQAPVGEFVSRRIHKARGYDLLA